MANALDLEEQEQLAQIKHFWAQYGNAISWALILVMGAYAAWNFYNYWQRNQAAQAGAMFDEVERVIQSGDAQRAERAFADMRDRFGSTLLAQQAGLLMARQQYGGGNADGAKASLTWVKEHAGDAGYQAIARLRLAGLLLDTKNFDGALAELSWTFPPSFDALVADRRGDILVAQGKRAEAVEQFRKAYKALESRDEYRRLVEVKLNALAIDPQMATESSAVVASQPVAGVKP